MGITRRIIVWQWWTDSCGGPEAREECTMAHGLASALSDRQTDVFSLAQSCAAFQREHKSPVRRLPDRLWWILNAKCHFRLPCWLVSKDAWSSSCLFAVSFSLSSYRNWYQSRIRPTYQQFPRPYWNVETRRFFFLPVFPNCHSTLATA